MAAADPTAARFAVWGDPIEHSLSPALHRAAYAALGLAWSYDRRRVTTASFADALAGLDGAWRGLSLTMPLKEAAFEAAATVDDGARRTRAVNTLVLGPGGPRGANTDIAGLAAALAEAGFAGAATARLLGAGRTTASAVLSLAALGVARIDVRARRPEAARALVALGADAGVTVSTGALEGEAEAMDVTVSTLPGGTELSASGLDALATGPLFDVAYAPWPSALAAQWRARGRAATPGETMLLHQALLQIRLFHSGSTADALPDEARVVAAMRGALGL